MADTQTRQPRGMRWVLILSLGLNLLVVGVVAGSIAFGPKERRGMSPNPGGALPYLRALAPDDRDALREAMRPQGPKGPKGERSGRKDPLVSYGPALELLRQDTFDVEAFAAHLAAQSADAKARQLAGQVLLSERLAQMSDADRLAYADRLEEALLAYKERRGPPKKK